MLHSLCIGTDTSDEFGQVERPVSGSSFRGAGTFPYISPEQQDHTRRKKVDAKTDIYALGIILFELHYPKKIDENQRSDVRIIINITYCIIMIEILLFRYLVRLGVDHFHQGLKITLAKSLLLSSH